LLLGVNAVGLVSVMPVTASVTDVVCVDAFRSDGLAGAFFSHATAVRVNASALHIPKDFSFMGSYQLLRDRVYNEIQSRV
jgi:hypothetical protein